MKKERYNKQSKLNKLNKIVHKCGVLHNTPVEKCNIQKLANNVQKGYKLAFNLMKNAVKNKNVKMFEDIYHISYKLLPDTSKQDSVFLNWLGKYKLEFCTNVIFLVSEYSNIVLIPKIKAMKKNLKKADTEGKKEVLNDRLNTIYSGFPLHFYLRKKKPKTK